MTSDRHGRSVRPAPALRLVLAWAVFLLFMPSSPGSDHADPIDPLMFKDLEAGITDLFAFPNDDNLVLILCVRRALTTSPPLELEPYTYHIYVDAHSEVNYDDPDTLARYGGKVLRPDSIREDVAITFRLNDDASLSSLKTRGLRNDVDIADREQRTELLRWWTGIRDDPFIFFRFHTTNVVAMVVEIPLAQFPGDRKDFLIWGTSSKFGRQIDHVGRSLRTMLPRLGFLNTLPPSEHVQAIRRRHERPGVVQDVGATYFSAVFGIRHYDFEPDVMILSTRHEIGFPNARLLTDDVAKLCCDQGDCLLWEVSLAEAHAEHQPRPTQNNKPFLDEFPYLAEPNPERPPAPSPRLSRRSKLILAAVGFILLAFILGGWVLWWRCRKRSARADKPGERDRGRQAHSRVAGEPPLV